MPRLTINVDHVATIRQARLAKEPDPVSAAALAELAGAHGIVTHLREDRRHIQLRDIKILRETIKTRLNLEMASTQEMVRIALDIKPDLVTLVPEKRQELTTEGGLDVILNKEQVQSVIRLLNDSNIPVSIFIDADLDQIKMCHRIGSQFVEIHTGHYADETDKIKKEDALERITESVRFANKLGLGVNAGHGLDYTNVSKIALIPGITELSIGHAIVARAVLHGFEKAVADMLALIKHTEIMKDIKAV